MPSIIPGYEYDIFISYRQKDNKHNGWITSFVENLKGELESTFKEEISVYFDINPHDGLLETHDVDASLKEKLKCLVFIPIISRTYCDPKSFAWEHEFKAFIEQAGCDQFGLKVKLSDGNIALRVLPVQIHELDANDKNLVERELGGYLRGIEFIYWEPGVNRPLVANEDHPDHNLNKTFYRNQINKVANAIKEILNGLENQGNEEKNNAKRISEFKPLVRKNLNFKIIIGSIFFLALVVSGYFVIPGLTKHKDKIEKSIAVLPFVNDSPDKEDEYVCTGMMERILDNLQKIIDLNVKSRTSTERFRNKEMDITDIGRALDVSYLLEGSVMKSGDNLHVATRLIDAKTGDRVWSQQYDGKYTSDIFVFQSEIAKKVAASLQAVISPSERRRIDERPTTGIIANDLLMRAEDMVRKWRYTGDSINLKLAFNLLNQALKVDPVYVDAITEKSRIFSETGNYDSALFYIRKIKTIDPENIDYYDLTGLYYFYNNVPDSALRYFLKVDEIRPNNVWTKLVIGQIYIFQKHEQVKGLTYYQKSIDLGGASEPEINHSISTIYSYIDYFPKAEKYLKNALSITSSCEISLIYNYIILNEGNYNKAGNFLDSICNVTACQQNCDLMRFYLYTTQKNFEKAEKYYKKALSEGYKNDDKADLYIKRADETDLYIGYLYSETGRKKEATTILNKFIQRDKNELALNARSWGYSILNLHLAAAYSILGDNKNALFHLNEVAKGDPYEWPFKVKTFPGFDKLRNNPEFISVLKHIEDKKADIRTQVREMEQRKEITL
jgi:TolB-like protein/Tfp pilus assembly protein PilF